MWIFSMIHTLLLDSCSFMPLFVYLIHDLRILLNNMFIVFISTYLLVVLIKSMYNP